MHALVLMAPSGSARVTPELRADHERFIDVLDKDSKVVPGADRELVTGHFEGGADVVRCASLDEAREIAGSDPLVRANAIRCEVTEWELIGINVSEIDREALPLSRARIDRAPPLSRPAAVRRGEQRGHPSSRFSQDRARLTTAPRRSSR